MPTPMPAASATGSSRAGTAAQPASGVTTTAATSIEAARPSMPLAPRDAVAEHDVEREQPGVGEGERDAERLALEPHVREQVDAERTATSSAAALRRVRAPAAASAITGRNSIAATVPSGSRSMAR